MALNPDIIIAPVVTEKSNDELQQGKYTFKVNKKAIIIIATILVIIIVILTLTLIVTMFLLFNQNKII